MYKPSKIKLLFLPILASVFLLQCSKVEENFTTEDFETSQTQSVQDVFGGLLNQDSSRLNGRTSEDNQGFVSVNLDDISLEPLTNSTAMLTVVPAILSGTPSTYSRAIALDYGGKTHTAILSLIPNNNNQSIGFSGYSITYKLSGEIINAYRIEADTIVAKLLTPNMSVADSPISDNSGLRIVDGCDCDTSPLPDCCFEEQLLDEVVIIANTGGIPAEHLFEPSEHEGIDLDAQEPVSLLVGGGGSLWVDCEPGYERDNYGNCVTAEEDCGEGYEMNEDGECVVHIDCGPDLELNASGECVEEDEFEYPFVHCSTFEYANGLNGLVKSAAVRNIHNTFSTFRGSGTNTEIRYANIQLPVMYFNLPPILNNGSAATLSALALGDAIDLTDDYLDANPYISLYELELVFKQNINQLMNTIGGTASTVESFSILNPSEYIVSLFSNGNCN